jgi:glyoxylase I family protein
MDIESLHHVSLPVTDLERARRFYAEVLGLREIERPPFDFPGSWFKAGTGGLHLIARTDATFRTGKGVDSRDIHFGVRVTSFRAALEHLQSKGYREDAEDELLRMKVNRHATAGFPQIYILDPDRNVIEINAAQLDVD